MTTKMFEEYVTVSKHDIQTVFLRVKNLFDNVKDVNPDSIQDVVRLFDNEHKEDVAKLYEITLRVKNEVDS